MSSKVTQQARIYIGQKGLAVRRAASATDTGGSQFALHDDGDVFTFPFDTSDGLDEHIYNSCVWYLKASAAQGGNSLLFLKGSPASGSSRYTLEGTWGGKGDNKTLPKTGSGGTVVKAVSISGFTSAAAMADWIITQLNAFQG